MSQKLPCERNAFVHVATILFILYNDYCMRALCIGGKVLCNHFCSVLIVYFSVTILHQEIVIRVNTISDS